MSTMTKTSIIYRPSFELQGWLYLCVVLLGKWKAVSDFLFFFKSWVSHKIYFEVDKSIFSGAWVDEFFSFFKTPQNESSDAVNSVGLPVSDYCFVFTVLLTIVGCEVNNFSDLIRTVIANWYIRWEHCHEIWFKIWWCYMNCWLCIIIDCNW